MRDVPQWIKNDLLPFGKDSHTPTVLLVDYEALRREAESVEFSKFRLRLNRFKIVFAHNALLKAIESFHAREPLPKDSEESEYGLYRDDIKKFMAPFNSLMSCRGFVGVEFVMRQQSFFKELSVPRESALSVKEGI